MIGYSTTVIEKMKEMQCQYHCIYDILRYVTMDYVWGLSSRIFQSHGDVTIAGEGLHFVLCLALMTIEQGGFFSVPTPTVT